MDEVDVQLLMLLFSNSRRTFRELGAQVNLSVNAVHRRIQSLVESGFIQKFSAHQSIHMTGGFRVLIFGKCTQVLSDHITQQLGTNENTLNLLVASGNQLYVYGLLRSIHELDSFTRFVKVTTGMIHPEVGVLHHKFLWNVPSSELITISPLSIDQTDLAIIRSLHHDARKTLAEVAIEIGASVQTVKRRLDKLMTNSEIELTIEMHPNYSSGNLTFLHIQLKSQIDRDTFLIALKKKQSPHLCVLWTFSNLPQLVIVWVWTESMKELEDVTQELKDPNIEIITPNILFAESTFETWRDYELYKPRK